MRKAIFFPLETKSRELDSKILITYELFKNYPDEWTVFLGHYKKIPYLWKNINTPFVVFEKGLIHDITRYKKILKGGGKTVLLDEEGGVFTKSHSKSPRGSGNAKSLKYIQEIFCWGEKEKRKWESVGKFSNNKFHITSNPRMELSQKKFFKYFSKLNPVNEKYILISAAFGSGNSITNKNDEINYWKKKGVKEVTNSYTIAKFQKKSLYPYLKGIKKIVQHSPNEKFILRPHPTEKIETYINYFKEVKNIEIKFKGSIQEWLHGAKIHIHNGCTTAIEGFLSGLDPICYSPINDDQHSQYLTYDVSDIANNEDELIEIYEDKLKNKKWSVKKRSNILKKLNKDIYCKDLNSSKKISYIINNIFFDQLGNKKMDFRKLKYNYFFSNYLNKLRYPISFCKNILTRSYDIKLKLNLEKRNKIKFDGLSHNDINFRLKNFEKLFNQKVNVKISKLDNDVFILQN